jgi:hypothetical protein
MKNGMNNMLPMENALAIAVTAAVELLADNRPWPEENLCRRTKPQMTADAAKK